MPTVKSTGALRRSGAFRISWIVIPLLVIILQQVAIWKFHNPVQPPAPDTKVICPLDEKPNNMGSWHSAHVEVVNSQEGWYRLDDGSLTRIYLVGMNAPVLLRPGSRGVLCVAVSNKDDSGEIYYFEKFMPDSDVDPVRPDPNTI